MKKKILISTHTLRLGGVERSFLGLLQHFDYSKFEVDVFLHMHDGELLKYLPKEVNLLPENKECRFLLEPIQSAIKERVFSVVFTKIISKFYDAVFNLFHKKNADKLDSIAHFHLHEIANFFFSDISSKEYDVAIAFLHPNHLERNKLKAKKYLAFIHTDFLALNIDKGKELKMWQQYNEIAGVSDEVSSNFKKVFPKISDKVTTIENIISVDFINKQANEPIADAHFFVETHQLCFLSIGRFSYPKNFDNIPFIAKFLKEKGVNFKWFIIGFGGGEELIRKNILLAKVEKEVIILGKKENPYPYIKACDFYIQPSRFEGKAVTVREAQILKKPVFIANYSTSESQVKNEFDGFILPLENEAFANEMISIIQNAEKIKKVKDNLETLDLSNKSEILKIEKFIEN